MFHQCIESLAASIGLINASVLFFISMSNHKSTEEKKGGKGGLLSKVLMSAG
jgi:hypothetical protein